MQNDQNHEITVRNSAPFAMYMLENTMLHNYQAKWLIKALVNIELVTISGLWRKYGKCSTVARAWESFNGVSWLGWTQNSQIGHWRRSDSCEVS
jgi:hypothetical protein